MTDRVLHLYMKFLELQMIQNSNDIMQCAESLGKNCPNWSSRQHGRVVEEIASLPLHNNWVQQQKKPLGGIFLGGKRSKPNFYFDLFPSHFCVSHGSTEAQLTWFAAAEWTITGGLSPRLRKHKGHGQAAHPAEHVLQAQSKFTSLVKHTLELKTTQNINRLK